MMSTSLFLVVWLAQSAAPSPAPPKPVPPPAVVSPEVTADRKIIFRLHAPDAASVSLRAGDLQGLPRGGPEFTKNEKGIWEATVGPVVPGAYRYTFAVAGVPVMDPRNPDVSLSNGNAWSMVYVPGSDFQDAAKVPHGAVSAVNYLSTALGRHRRMHVYTPPGYELGGKEKYPVFYLLHGAGDCDESWTSVGRAGFILDNLIAAKKAKPMIVVMPAGHTSTAGFRPQAAGRDEFAEDFVKDIVPYVEKNYRVLAGRANRAIAGLSMGGNQTLGVSMSHLDQYAYIGVFSSGIFRMGPRPAGGAAPAPGPSPEWIAERKQMLENPALKKELKLLWFKTGVDDFLMPSTKATVDFFKQQGFSPVFQESAGGHTWLNWRDYLNEFAPQLFH
jgi:enterochelin esterase-like enzyme